MRSWFVQIKQWSPPGQPPLNLDKDPNCGVFTSLCQRPTRHGLRPPGPPSTPTVRDFIQISSSFRCHLFSIYSPFIHHLSAAPPLLRATVRKCRDTCNGSGEWRLGTTTSRNMVRSDKLVDPEYLVDLMQMVKCCDTASKV